MSHGVPRASGTEQKTREAAEKELKDIQTYRSLVDRISKKVMEEDFSPELLQETAELLSRNPEYYTIWNYRRRIYAAEFASLTRQVQTKELSEKERHGQVLQILQLDLQFLFPLLLKFPKCYWIWNHRLWLLEQASLLLPTSMARPIWEDELGLVGKMLGRDSRNFHGWRYRRIVVANLESSTLDGSSMAKSELDYTTKMIRQNLSNFSAWHNRTKLIARFLDEDSADDDQRQAMLDEELELIHKALFDPYDQSLWFYHQTLMCCFDEDTASRTFAPNLSHEERSRYVENERGFIEELLDDVDDSKWVYQALIECVQVQSKLDGHQDEDRKREMLHWLSELMRLDPLRKGRWTDLRRSIEEADAQ